MSGSQGEKTGSEGDLVEPAAGPGLAAEAGLGMPARAESDLADGEISAGIAERLARVNFGEELAAEGVTTVCLDADDNLVEYRPDGTSVTLTRL